MSDDSSSAHIPAAREACGMRQKELPSSSHQKLFSSRSERTAGRRRLRQPRAPDARPLGAAALMWSARRHLDEKAWLHELQVWRRCVNMRSSDRKKKQLSEGSSDVFFGQLSATATMAERRVQGRGQAPSRSPAASSTSVVRRHVPTTGLVPLKAPDSRRSSDDDGEDTRAHADRIFRLARPLANIRLSRHKLERWVPSCLSLPALVVAASSGVSAFGSHHDQDCLLPSTLGNTRDEQNPAKCGTPKTRRTSGWSSSSNQEFTPKEFEAWRTAMQEAAMPLPTVQFMGAQDLRMTLSLEKIIQEKRRFVSLSVNPAYRKAQLLKERGLAELRGRPREGAPTAGTTARMSRMSSAAPAPIWSPRRGDPFHQAHYQALSAAASVRSSCSCSSSSSSPSQPASPSSPSLPLPANRHQPPPLLPTPRHRRGLLRHPQLRPAHRGRRPGGGHPGGLPQQPGGAGDLLARSAQRPVSLNLD
uniref:POPLD domain-containing protein n=1 Tax=Macrostomum lignano TaxID=282301 RepID=A0A1I8JNK9_9PLAT